MIMIMQKLTVWSVDQTNIRQSLPPFSGRNLCLKIAQWYSEFLLPAASPKDFHFKNSFWYDLINI